MLGVMKYSDYIIEYQLRGSTVTEQVLNLSPVEKERIWGALLKNYEPENREYRYNFFSTTVQPDQPNLLKTMW